MKKAFVPRNCRFVPESQISVVESGLAFYAYAVRSGPAILPNCPTGHCSILVLFEGNCAERKFGGGGLKPAVS